MTEEQSAPLTIFQLSKELGEEQRKSPRSERVKELERQIREYYERGDY